MTEQIIGIVAANNLQVSPYIYFYKRILDGIGLRYELIYPDRNDLPDEWEGSSHVEQWNNSIPGIINYYRYSRKVKRIAKRKKYSKLIVLTTMNAVFLSGWLRRNYRGKYLVDIRDYTYENNCIYRWFEKRSITKAGEVVVSSKAFETFLPKYNYSICHNISVNTSSNTCPWRKHAEPIVISYIGSLSYASNVIKLIDAIKHDQRFIFEIHGGGPAKDEITKAVEESNCNRIKCFGPYKPQEKAEIIQRADILFNAYGNSTLLVTTALSNKLYDAFYYHKLLLNSSNTYMEAMSGICGYSINLEEEHCLDGLFNWYEGLRADDINGFQNRGFRRFCEENQLCETRIKSFLTNRI